MEPNIDRMQWSVVAMLGAVVIGGVILLAFPRISGKIANGMNDLIDNPGMITGGGDKEDELVETNEPLTVMTFTQDSTSINLPFQDMSGEGKLYVVAGEYKDLEKNIVSLNEKVIGEPVAIAQTLDINKYTEEGAKPVQVIYAGKYEKLSGQNDTLLDIPKFDTKEAGVKEVTELTTLGSKLVGNPGMNDWDMSEVVNLKGIFRNSENFNQPIGKWDTSNVKDLSYAFKGADEFNQPLKDWNTSNVTTLSSVFDGAKKFNQDINTWDTGKVTNFGAVFSGASEFNKPLDKWVISKPGKTVAMRNMFSHAKKFNQPLNAWDVSGVEDFNQVFYFAESFNQDLNSWDVSNSTIMTEMFRNAVSFNGNISDWNVKRVMNANGLFLNAVKFNKDLSKWTMPNLGGANYMFANAASLDTTIPGIDLTKATQLEGTFMGTNSQKLIDSAINGKNFPKLENASYMFADSGYSSIDMAPIARAANIKNVNYLFADTRNLGVGADKIKTTITFNGFGYTIARENNMSKRDKAIDVDYSLLGSNQKAKPKLKEIKNFNNFVSSKNIKTYNGMFAGLDLTSTLNIGGWDTDNAISYHAMFEGFSAPRLDGLDSLKMTNTLDTSFMFRDSNIAGGIIANRWNPSKVKYATGMFLGNKSKINGSNTWKFSSLENGVGMFAEMRIPSYGLTGVVTNINPNAKDLSYMFYGADDRDLGKLITQMKISSTTKGTNFVDKKRQADVYRDLPNNLKIEFWIKSFEATTYRDGTRLETN